ncbi:hypothetical protein COS31_04735 [Candidatus Roizmanbacteria bacterium CG02_land_8_20_14_3_00_36_15]|uniref:Uncharacterized protein n=2 Tax=Candidatus Roizmaniibacteriota TaxID=1752723 RepID=A0A2M8KKA7_9BACT|nr:MAG: hypothetical protein COS51_01965 [Candidatus Roizmanbacteria bacterium CG03_land_8_20_14_0_80_36_21]PIV37472.1 MAG: hypothetical protein COS31_04735 [Candidatus Roizmanbacteria bacterium CG02_land_8_20_14_3_00_36_15]PIY70548.1 MAG: hypothetical protein COY89_00790 [Candidatus Roizmanbacteria bacterium CG_4_10_14_0_8_um_filter_36_36]PJA52657.1 MAG: hypothetical protein CO166_05075 [Candidatus Roizmanbacteria bacterium CG_4_9_14_3_um_filter_36_11]PJC81547.1 MAG: hypothetical protein CO007
MKITKKTDIFNLMTELKSLLDHKPSHDQMIKEVQMMSFKIRPVAGDISLLNFKNQQLIEVLWGLGKIDDFFRKEFRRLRIHEKKTFFKLVGQMRGKLETQLNKINFRKPIETPQAIEMEIVKEYPRKKN